MQVGENQGYLRTTLNYVQNAAIMFGNMGSSIGQAALSGIGATSSAVDSATRATGSAIRATGSAISTTGSAAKASALFVGGKVNNVTKKSYGYAKTLGHFVDMPLSSVASVILKTTSVVNNITSFTKSNIATLKSKGSIQLPMEQLIEVGRNRRWNLKNLEDYQKCELALSDQTYTKRTQDIIEGGLNSQGLPTRFISPHEELIVDKRTISQKNGEAFAHKEIIVLKKARTIATCAAVLAGAVGSVVDLNKNFNNEELIFTPGLQSAGSGMLKAAFQGVKMLNHTIETKGVQTIVQETGALVVNCAGKLTTAAAISLPAYVTADQYVKFREAQTFSAQVLHGIGSIAGGAMTYQGIKSGIVGQLESTVTMCKSAYAVTVFVYENPILTGAGAAALYGASLTADKLKAAYNAGNRVDKFKNITKAVALGAGTAFAASYAYSAY